MTSVRLTDNQRRIVEAGVEQCVLVNAGPGTGKTHVLVERVVHLLTKHQIPLERILLVTFSRKAARELRERLARRLLEEKLLSTILELDRAWVLNYHGLCFRILREHCLAAGFEPGTRIQDPVQRLELAEAMRWEIASSELAEEALAEVGKGNPVPAGVVERLTGWSASLSEIVNGLDRARESRLRAEDTAGRSSAALDELGKGDSASEAEEDRLAHEFFAKCLLALEADYDSAKRTASTVDFVDLQTLALDFLETPRAKRVREHFDVVLVDEFQDTNLVQFRLVELLTKPGFANLMAVGDERQAIYAFRGAQLSNIRELPERVEAAGGTCRQEYLYESYRSYQEILDTSVGALFHVPGAEGQLASAGVDDRPPLKSMALGLAAEDSEVVGPVIQTFRADDKSSEAEWIADQIQTLVGTPIVSVEPDGARSTRPLRYGDFAVLLRGVGSAKAYEQAMRAQQIPYRTFGGSGFFDRVEVLDLMAYLQVIANPYDGLALIRILQNPPFGLSPKSLHRLANLELQGSGGEVVEEDAHEDTVRRGFRLQPFDALERSFRDAELAAELGLGAESLERLHRLWDFVTGAIRRRGTVPVSRLLLEVIEETGYGKLLLADDQHAPLESLRRRKNVSRLLRLARRFEDRHIYGSLHELVRYLLRATQEESIREEEAALESDDRVVNVSTVHVAKGKEWPVVFVAGMTDQSWPIKARSPEVVYDEELGLFLRRSVLGEATGAKSDLRSTLLADAVAARGTEPRDQEERRVLFVAMTRAKNLLFCTGHTYRTKTKFLDRITACLPEVQESPSVAAEAAGAGRPRVPQPSEEPSVTEAELKQLVEQALEAPEPQATPTESGPRGVHLSFSHLAQYSACPLRYKFTFVTPLPGAHQGAGFEHHQLEEGVEATELPPAELGTIFHEALERWAHEDRELPALIDQAARDRGWHSLHEADRVRAKEFLEQFLASRLGQSKPATDHTEVPFTLVLGPESAGAPVVTVSGSIDRIDPDPDAATWSITDYKTNRRVTPERYALQLSIYRLALERVFQRQVSASYVYFVRHPEEKGLKKVETLSSSETEAEVLKAAAQIARGEFEIKEHPGKAVCWGCPFGGKDGFCPEKRLK